jgi:photosystem II stability/assembly factor-like uncharacterized protein
MNAALKYIILSLILTTINYSCKKEVENNEVETVTNNCANWTPINFDNFNDLVEYNVVDLSLNSNNEVYLSVNFNYMTVFSGSIFKSINGGQNWTTIYEASGAFGYIPQNIFVVHSDTIYALGSGTIGKALCKSFDGGSTWNYKDIYNSSIPGAIPSSLFFTSPDIGYVGTENYGILKTIDGGNSWINSTNTSNLAIQSITFTNDSIGYSLSDHMCLKTNNSGLSWDTIYNNSSMNLKSMNFINSNTGIIFGDQIIKTTDGGNSWTSIYNQEVKSASFKTPNTIYAITADNHIYMTENGGNNWVIDCENTLNYTKIVSNSTNQYIGTNKTFNNDQLNNQDLIILKK